MKYTTRAKAKKEIGVGYLGSVNMTTKHAKAYGYNEMTYGLYLAPANMSGYEVCPMRTEECTNLCLNGSGMSLIYTDMINNSRIKKTQLFFENRDYFMGWLIDEITFAKNKAERLGFKFSVRLNNTSDISPESFYTTIDGKKKNILEIFPDVMFYDYTKVPKRYMLLGKYKNYDLTFSFSGLNINECELMLLKGIRVAVVFKNLPETFWGRKVINGDLYDMRYYEPKNVIVGLKFKTVKKRPDKESKFVV